MQDNRWDSNPRETRCEWEELSKEGTLSEAQVMVYDPEFTEETKSEATSVLGYSIYTSMIKSSHRELIRRVS